MNNALSLFGLGKLGLPLALCHANVGTTVYGVDINTKLISDLQIGIIPFYEPSMYEYLKKAMEEKTFFPTIDYEIALQQSDVSIVITATPSNENGEFSNIYLVNAISRIGEILSKLKKEYHVIVISSTVVPGTIEKELIPALIESSSNYLIPGINVDIVFDPDFVALGQVINDFENPDFVLIGSDSARGREIVKKYHSRIVKNNAKFIETNLINAQISKVCLNAYICTKISFANMISQLTEKIAGADPDEITNTIGIDKRIGLKYFKAGLPYGGTCFPRDAVALNSINKLFGLKTQLMNGVENTNINQTQYINEKILSLIKESKFSRVFIVGLSFKSGTQVTEKSMAIELYNFLNSNIQVEIVGLDKLVKENQVSFDVYAEFPKELFLESHDLFIYMHGFEKEISEMKKAITIFDCWRNFKNISKEFKNYHALGIKSC